MIYKRLIATIPIIDGIAVQSIGFHKYLPIGKPEIVAEFLSDWGIDEIVLTDIKATHEMRTPASRSSSLYRIIAPMAFASSGMVPGAAVS